MTADQIMKKTETQKVVSWSARAVKDAIAVREELVPKLLEQMDWYYKRLLEPGWSPFASFYYRNINSILLLAKMKETRVYPKLLQFMRLPYERARYAVSETKVDEDVLYSVYDGSLAETEALFTDTNYEISELQAACIIDMMGMLCRDGRLAREELIRFLREIVEKENTPGLYLFQTSILGVMERLHLHELILTMRDYLLRDHFFEGDYEYSLDMIFEYEDAPVVEWVGWDAEGNCMADGPTPFEREIIRWSGKRNAPCICGSGKKFKDCCLKKQQALRIQYPDCKTFIDWDDPKDMDAIALELEPIVYPPIENVGDKPGLATYFPREGIEVDEHAFRAMRLLGSRPVQYQLTDVEIRIGVAEFWEAFTGFEKLCREKGIQTAAEYDRTYMVHFRAEFWMRVLREFLQKTGDDRLEAVEKWLAPDKQTAR